MRNSCTLYKINYIDLKKVRQAYNRIKFISINHFNTKNIRLPPYTDVKHLYSFLHLYSQYFLSFVLYYFLLQHSQTTLYHASYDVHYMKVHKNLHGNHCYFGGTGRWLTGDVVERVGKQRSLCVIIIIRDILAKKSLVNISFHREQHVQWFTCDFRECAEHYGVGAVIIGEAVLRTLRTKLMINKQICGCTYYADYQ